MNIIKLVFFLLMSTIIASASVETSRDAINKTKTGIDFYGETSFYFTTSKLVSVSKQIYIVNGAEVTEIVLDIEGSPSQVKIYHMQLISPQQVQQTAINTIESNIQSTQFTMKEAERATDVANKNLKNVVGNNMHIQLPEVIMKMYPASTHSKTIEFAIHSIDDLEQLYSLISKAFTSKAKEEKINGTLYKIIKLNRDKK